MEECKSMGIKVLGPDINESQRGFAVNQKGEIRFGFSGLKGTGDAAIDNIIEERNKHGHFKDVFDMVKRVNLRAVNKKSMESLIYGGAFDCFTQFHRAMYFHQHQGDTSNLEKIVKFGSIFQNQTNTSSNTLFGEMEMPEITPPTLPICEPWQLVEQLDFEKEVTGMFISGHPLDNYLFEMKHYNIAPLEEYTIVKNNTETKPTGQTFRLAGLVIDAQHRISKNGKNFGVLHLEDFSGKAEFMLWGEDYVRYSNYLEKGRILMVEGNFKQRFNTDQYEFKFNRLHLLDSVKSNLTKQVIIGTAPEYINADFVAFMEENVKKHPGNSALKFNIISPAFEQVLSMSTFEKGFTMNDEMAEYLNLNKQFQVTVVSG